MSDTTSTPSTTTGEQETGGQAQEATTPPQSAEQSTPGATTPPEGQQAAQQPATPAEWDGKVESLPEGAQKIIRDLRAEAASDRTNAKTQAAENARAEMAQELGKALGLIKSDDDKAPDADQLTEQLTTAQRQAREAAVELAVFKAAGPLNANPQTLLDSRSFMTSLADVDPTDSEAITAAITAAVNADARFKATQAAARSGGDLPGGTGEGAVTKEQFDRMTPAEKNRLFQTDPTTYRQLTGRE